MTKLITSIIVAAAMVLIGTAAMACSDLSEFTLITPTCMDKSIEMMKADSSLALEIMFHKERWDEATMEQAVNTMIYLAEKYHKAGVSEGGTRLIFTFSNSWPGLEEFLEVSVEGTYIRFRK